ncbi:hypothetical protein FOIG_10216 [Fusarium odoratissimum NRRL 54006]|uniref:Uncharacterized protein n=1 Tax=Fusarium odoratissimum (strain NRRL 54006) TaxID=1089451 RepID=X0KM61_FUSO5|nr:uncharacterized protein FOIG_10216 [Fusarium odoratissimum NRRL 54006]EXL97914.1 hypothetical protein FOIG_10216 [Fusarium odoratissimum NRRL 54006]
MDVPIATGTSVHGAICNGHVKGGRTSSESEKLFSPTGQKLAIGSDSERVENVLLKDEMRITDVLVLERLAMNGGWKNELY